MPAAHGRTTSRRQRRLALAGLVAPAVLVLGVLIAGLRWPGYDHRSQNLSDLGGIEAPIPALLNGAFILFGLLVMVFAVALSSAGADRSQARIGYLSVGYFGVTQVVLGITPCTPGCADGTPVDLVHIAAATTGLIAVGIGMLSYWRAARTGSGPSPYITLSVWSATLTFVLLATWLAAVGIDPERLHAGLLQRTLLGVVLIWLMVTAARLIRPPRAGGLHIQ